MLFIYGVLSTIAHADTSVQSNMKETIYDKRAKNGKTYLIFEAVPDKVAPDNGWPVIYLLDGNTTYPLAKEQMPNAILIGMGYPTDNKDEIVQQRYFDLTTQTAPENIPLREGMKTPTTGGEGSFRSFINDELMPDINQRLPVDKKRTTLFGHSLGGIFSLRSSIETPNAFQTICAIDPSIWWNKHAFMKELDTFSPIKNMPRLLIETAGKKVEKPHINQRNVEKVKALRRGPNGQDVANIFSKHKKIDVFYRHFNDESHGSIIKPALHDCLALTLDQKNPYLQTLISKETNK